MAALASVAAVLLALGTLVSSWEVVRAKEAAAEQRRLRLAAQTAQASEAKERRAAVALAYASDVNLAQHAVKEKNLGRALELLNRHGPQHGQLDSPGWEWRYLWQECQSDALDNLCQRTNVIRSLATSQDGRWLAVVEFDGAVSIWDLRSRREVALPSAGNSPGFAAFAPGQDLLALSTAMGKPPNYNKVVVLLCDVSTGQLRRTLSLDDWCYGLAFSKDGQRLATATLGPEGRIAIWDIASGRPLASYSAPTLTFRSSGPTLAVTADLTKAAYQASDPRKISLLDLEIGNESWTIEAGLAGFARPREKWSFGWVRSRSDRLFIGCWGASAIRQWDVGTGIEMPSWARPASARCGDISPSGRLCLTFGWDTKPALRDLNSGQDFNADLQITDPLDVAFSPDGKWVAAVSMRGLPGDLSSYVRVWDASTFREVASFTAAGISITFSPDSSRLAVGAWGRPEAIKLWNTQTWQEILTLEGSPGNVAVSVAFSPDGNLIGARDTTLGVVHLWRAPAWSEIAAAEKAKTQ